MKECLLSGVSGGGADAGLPLVRLYALLPGKGDLVSLETVLTETLVRAGREAARKRGCQHPAPGWGQRRWLSGEAPIGQGPCFWSNAFHSYFTEGSAGESPNTPDHLLVCLGPLDQWEGLVRGASAGVQQPAAIFLKT